MAEKRLNRRLTTLDAGFLYAERPNQPMHVGGCMIYEGHISKDDLVRILQERMHLLPRYRQKAVFPPFGLAHPTWEDDPDFDVRHHVEELTLPAPADDRVLSEFGGQVYGPMLDRNRPLWKLILLQGRPDGNTAMIWKIHHSMVDGVSSVDLAMVMHDLQPNAPPPPRPATPWQPQPMPDTLTLLQDAVRDQLMEAAERWTDATFRPLRPREAEEQAQRISRAITSSMPAMLQPAPPTPWNGPISDRRQFAWLVLPFAAIRGIRSALGGTVNDVVLAILSGALRRYLHAHGYPTEGVELRAMCPVSMRRAEERGALGNLVSIMIAPLYVGIADPIERLRAERAAMDRLKQADQAGGLYEMNTLAGQLPPPWQAAAAQTPVVTSPLNTVSTNVPGPQIPLYLGGRRLLEWYPLGICSANIGLFVAILSYNQQLTFGTLVDPQLVPDVWFLIDCLWESFEELRVAAERTHPEILSAVVTAEEIAASAQRAAVRG